MVNRSELEVAVRNMVAFDILSKPLTSLGQKADRRKDKIGEEISTLLKEGEQFERVVAYVERRDEEKARTMREGIGVFKEEFPKYGKILESKIAERRNLSNRYLVYGVADGFKLSADDYRRVMKDLGVNTLEADAMYPHLIQISDRLGKARENSLRSILL